MKSAFAASLLIHVCSHTPRLTESGPHGLGHCEWLPPAAGTKIPTDTIRLRWPGSHNTSREIGPRNPITTVPTKDYLALLGALACRRAIQTTKTAEPQ